jgi:DNA-binding beta-propeller fold protein YncE
MTRHPHSRSLISILFFQARWLEAFFVGALALQSVSRAETPAGVGPGGAAPGATGYHLAVTWKPGGEGGWDYLTVDAKAHRLYIARMDRVQVIDTENGSLMGEVPGLDGAHGVALAPEFGRGFATSGKSGTLIVFDLQTLKPIGAPVTAGKKPDAIAYEPFTKRVFAFNGGSGDATVIDAEKAGVIGTVALEGKPEFGVADGKGSVFVNLEDKSEILEIDARSLTVKNRWSLAPGESPTGLAIDPAKGRLFSGCRNEKMIILDAGTGKSFGALPIGKGVDAAIFDAGSGLAFASNGDGTLTVIGESAGKPGEFRVLENVATKVGSRTAAIDSNTHAIYLAGADFEPAPPAKAGEPRVRPKMIPGSFVVLKFENR